MKRKAFTKNYDIDILKKVDNNGHQFTAEEHSYATEQEFASKFESQKTLLRWYLTEDASKLSALSFLIRYLNEEKFTNVLSLGSGTCVLEYLLKLALPEKAKVVATDFDSFCISKAKELLPDIIPVKFDFFKDNIAVFQAALGINFDIAVFFGSAYVMDDAIFIKLLRSLKEVGIKQIIDFHAGYMDNRTVFINFIHNILPFIYQQIYRIFPSLAKTISLKIFGRLPGEAYLGKFHGYSRSHSELKKLYKKAGVYLVRELKVAPYKYVAICNC